MDILKNYLEFLYGQENKVKIDMKVASAVIMKKGINGEKLILLIQRAKEDHFPNHWETPRGKCDKGKDEKLIHCLKREIKEETGLDIIPIKFIDKFQYLADKGTRRSTQYNFLCKMKNPDQEVKLSKEHQDHKWISSVGEAELLVLPEIKKTLVKVLNLDSRIIEYPQSGIEKIEEK